MKISEILRQTELGAVITDKRVLSVLKRNGLIHDYSQWGYLESDENHKYFKNGTSYIRYMDYQFDYVYLDGCFHPYLRLVSIVKTRQGTSIGVGIIDFKKSILN